MTLLLSRDVSYYLNRLRAIHTRLRDHLYRYLRTQEPSVLSAVQRDAGGDTQYRIDAEMERLLLDLCREWAREVPFVLPVRQSALCLRERTSQRRRTRAEASRHGWVAGERSAPRL